MIDCREATRLASESFDRKLSLRERLALRLHVMMCAMCREFSQQLEFIRDAAIAFSEIEAHAVYFSEIRLSSEARARIARSLARK